MKAVPRGSSEKQGPCCPARRPHPPLRSAPLRRPPLLPQARLIAAGVLSEAITPHRLPMRVGQPREPAHQTPRPCRPRAPPTRLPPAPAARPPPQRPPPRPPPGRPPSATSAAPPTCKPRRPGPAMPVGVAGVAQLTDASCRGDPPASRASTFTALGGVCALAPQSGAAVTATSTPTAASTGASTKRTQSTGGDGVAPGPPRSASRIGAAATADGCWSSPFRISLVRAIPAASSDTGAEGGGRVLDTTPGGALPVGGDPPTGSVAPSGCVRAAGKGRRVAGAIHGSAAQPMSPRSTGVRAGSPTAAAAAAAPVVSAAVGASVAGHWPSLAGSRASGSAATPPPRSPPPLLSQPVGDVATSSGGRSIRSSPVVLSPSVPPADAVERGPPATRRQRCPPTGDAAREGDVQRGAGL